MHPLLYFYKTFGMITQLNCIATTMPGNVHLAVEIMVFSTLPASEVIPQILVSDIKTFHFSTKSNEEQLHKFAARRRLSNDVTHLKTPQSRYLYHLKFNISLGNKILLEFLEELYPRAWIKSLRTPCWRANAAFRICATRNNRTCRYTTDVQCSRSLGLV